MKFLSPSQCRAARGLLNWSQPDLAQRCGMHVQTIGAFEQETGSPSKRTLQKITQTLENFGIEFLEDDDGVRRIHGKIKHLQGAEGFQNFMDEVYDVAKTQGGEICLHNAKPANWIKWLGVEWNLMHTERMVAIKDRLDFKITAGHNDYQMIGKHAEYRWLPKEMWNDQSFYAYGDRIALLNFEEDSVHIVVMHNKKFADGFRSLFNVAWDNVTIKPPKKDV